MATILYCWRCGTEVPMLDEQEWDQLGPYLTNAIEQIQAYRQKTGAPLSEARTHAFDAALEKYFELTGYRETNADALWHHRLQMVGPICSKCGKPLRTPAAKFCAECGEVRQS